jgi:hypothetical protein
MAGRKRLRSLDEFERLPWHTRKPARLFSINAVLGFVAIVGLSALTGASTTVRGRDAIAQAIKNIGAATDLRKRSPKAGDYWDGCNGARAAGTASIYRGEPGYREGMDGDGDGIACEPY